MSTQELASKTSAELAAGKVTVELPILARRIADLMVTALEHNHMVCSWCAGVRLRTPTEDEIEERHKSTHWYDAPELWAGEFEIDLWEISDENEYEGDFDPDDDADKPLPAGLTKRTFRKADLEQGIQLMATEHASHFGDFMGENEDAITADVFLQLVVLKEVVYG